MPVVTADIATIARPHVFHRNGMPQTYSELAQKLVKEIEKLEYK